MPKIEGYGPQRVSSSTGGSGLTSPNTTPGAPMRSARSAPAPMAPSARSIGGPGPTRQAFSPDTFGVAPMNPGVVGEAGARLGQAMQALAERIDTTAAEEALVQFEREKNRMFFDPENGYFNTQGRNAYDQASEVQEQLKDLRRRHAEELDSPRAQQMFSRATDSQLTRAQQDVMRHASTQFNAWEAATLQSRAENSLENASLYWNDPDQRAISLELGRQSLIDIAMIRGDSPESLAENLQTFNSKFAVNTIEAALTNSAEAGQVALADHTAMLEGPDLIKMQERVDQQFEVEVEQRNANSAVTMANSLVAQHGDAPNARQLIMEEVNQVEDADLQSRLRREAQYQLGVKQQADSEYRAQVFTEGEAFMAEGGSVEQFIAQNPDGWDALNSAQKSQLRRGLKVATNYEAMAELLTLPREQLARINPSDFFHVLGESDRTRLINAVDDAKNGTPESQVGRSRASQTTSAVNRLFGTPASRNSDTAAQADAMYALIDSEVRTQEREKDRRLTPDEYTKVINDMMLTTEVNRSQWWPGTTEYDLSSVPADEMRNISGMLRAAGMPVNANTIIQSHQSEIFSQMPLEDVAPLAEYLRSNGVSVTPDNLLRAYEQASAE